MNTSRTERLQMLHKNIYNERGTGSLCNASIQWTVLEPVVCTSVWTHRVLVVSQIAWDAKIGKKNKNKTTVHKIDMYRYMVTQASRAATREANDTDAASQASGEAKQNDMESSELGLNFWY